MSDPIIHLWPKAKTAGQASGADKGARPARHRRCARSFCVWLLLVNGIYIILLHSKTVNNADADDKFTTLPLITIEKNVKIRIFYNLFIKSAEEESRVVQFVSEQFSNIDPNLHEKDIFINSIGYPMSNFSDVQINQHYPEGGEDITLHSIWEYCNDETNRDGKVIYLHSKGSFHPDEKNNRMRRFLTEGALSDECANLPNDCDVCSSRMSPYPHPHTPGNMWLARCKYIFKLLDPYALRDGELPNEFNNDNDLKGFGRFFFEHWIYSHPSVRPCDVYKGKEYTWGYDNIPDVNFTKDLQKAPRRNAFVNSWYCGVFKKSVNNTNGYLEDRKWNYKQLYNVSMLNESWYLWDFQCA